MKRRFVTLFALVGLMYSLSAAMWTYDPNNGTLTDGNWTLTVTAEDTELTVVNCSGSGCLDLSGELGGFTVVKIGDDAIKTGRGTLTEFIAPSTLREIGKNAFQKQTSLASVTIESSDLSVIDENAFSGCSALIRVRIVSSALKRIGNSAFNSIPLTDTEAENLSLKSVEEIGDFAFDGSKLKGMVRLNAVKNIGRFAFRKCQSLTGLRIVSDALDSIGEAAFVDCKGVTDLELSMPNVRTIGQNAFLRVGGAGTACLELRRIETLGGSAFNSCKGLGEIRITSDALTEIAGFVFDECSASNVYLCVSNVTSIGNCAFRHVAANSDIGTWNLDSLVTAGEGAFWMPGLYGVPNLPSLTTLGPSCFRDTSISGLRLGTPEAVIFSGDPFYSLGASLQTILFGTKESLENTSVLRKFSGARDIVFWGPAQSADVLKTMLERTTNYKLRLIVSRRQVGWMNLVTPLTDADKAHADYPSDLVEQGMKVLGTTVGKLDKTVWVVHTPSPYDPKGLAVIVK